MIGLLWSGGHGVQRKVAGGEQGLHTVQQIVGMSLMGVGALVAVAGGVLFIAIMLHAIARRGRVIPVFGRSRVTEMIRARPAPQS